jgi:membrane protein implicated in regulation of membrane protease activity
MSFGIGAIITGLISMVDMHFTVQLAIFIVVTFIIFLNLRKLSKKLMQAEYPTNVDALIGKKGIVSEVITDECKYFVKVGGEIWSAVMENEGELKVTDKVKVVKIDGNKLIVKTIEE